MLSRGKEGLGGVKFREGGKSSKEWRWDSGSRNLGKVLGQVEGGGGGDNETVNETVGGGVEGGEDGVQEKGGRWEGLRQVASRAESGH